MVPTNRRHGRRADADPTARLKTGANNSGGKRIIAGRAEFSPARLSSPKVLPFDQLEIAEIKRGLID